MAVGRAAAYIRRAETDPYAGSAGATEMMAEGKRDPVSPPDGIEAAKAEFIRRRGVTRCPTACVLPTQGEVTDTDRAALSAYATGRELSRRARAAQRARALWLRSPGPDC